jgi:hypothetical protein
MTYGIVVPKVLVSPSQICLISSLVGGSSVQFTAENMEYTLLAPKGKYVYEHKHIFLRS